MEPPLTANHRQGAYELGFRPEASGRANQRALQRAVDQGGTIAITQPGTYALAGTVYLGSDTTLAFGAGVVVKKVAEDGPFSHVLLNKGARTKTFDERIRVTGLHLLVNGVDVRTFADVFGLHGQLAFFYVMDLQITGFRCYDLGAAQYGIHVCTFTDLLIQDLIIHGAKDGVHLGRGQRFIIRDGVFGTGDDAVALNGHDYDVGNPELGWIEHGLVENCHDLRQGSDVGFFCRILAGAWTDWYAGMEVQKSDTVVHAGRLYRVRAQPDGQVYRSLTGPTHRSGGQLVDGILWQVVQDDVTYTAGVRHVVFRNIVLEKPRTAFSIHFDHDRYSRSYYPGAPLPLQEQLTLEHIVVCHDQPTDFLAVNTPVDQVTIAHSTFKDNRIRFHTHAALPDPGITRLLLLACRFTTPGPLDLLTNAVPHKHLSLTTSASAVLHPSFTARVIPGPGYIEVASDLPGNGPRP